MPEIMMRLDGYLSPLIPLRTYEVVAGTRVIDTFEAYGEEHAKLVAQRLYPNSGIKFVPRLVSE